MDDVPVTAVRKFEEGLFESMRTVNKAVWEELNQKKALDKDIEPKLEAAIKAYKATFKA